MGVTSQIRLLTFRKQWIAQLHAQWPYVEPIADNGTITFELAFTLL
jgi:hypothetical protein